MQKFRGPRQFLRGSRDGFLQTRALGSKRRSVLLFQRLVQRGQGLTRVERINVPAVHRVAIPARRGPGAGVQFKTQPQKTVRY